MPAAKARATKASPAKISKKAPRLRLVPPPAPRARPKASPSKARATPRKSPSRAVTAKALVKETRAPKRAAPKRAAPKRTRAIATPPVFHAEVISAPATKKGIKLEAKTIIPWAIAIGLGALLLTSKRSTAATMPQAPALPSSPSPLPPPPPTPLPAPPSISSLAYWSPDGKTLNSLQGYHRATPSEVTPQLIQAAQAALKNNSIGQLVQGVQTSGKGYVIALEEHFHPPGGPEKPWGPHKGSSVFVQN